MGGTYKGESGTYDRGFANSYYKWEGKVLYGTDPGISTGAKNRYYAHRIDYGFVAGIGVILFNRVALDARYEWGNVDVDDGLGDFKNRAMLISIGVPLKLKGSDNSN